MPSFSNKSKAVLATCHPDLRKVMELAIQRIDFSVIEGSRDCAAQEAAVAAGFSKAVCGQSKHNTTPARAVDIYPYPFKAEYWKHPPTVWINQAQVVLACAHELGIGIRWGGDWNQNGDWRDERFFDGPHFELVG